MHSETGLLSDRDTPALYLSGGGGQREPRAVRAFSFPVSLPPPGIGGARAPPVPSRSPASGCLAMACLVPDLSSSSGSHGRASQAE